MVSPGEHLRGLVLDALPGVEVHPYVVAVASDLPFAQAYTDTETGGGIIRNERSSVLYLRLFAARESEIDDMRKAVEFLDGYTGEGMRVRLNTYNRTEEDDGGLMGVALYDVTHYA